MQHRIVQLALIATLLFTAFTLVQLSNSVNSPATLSATNHAVGLVQGYYGSLNIFLDGGDLELVTAHFGASAAIHGAGEKGPGNTAQFRDLLIGMRSSYPHSEVEVIDVFANGEDVVAQIRIIPGLAMLHKWMAVEEGPGSLVRYERLEVRSGLITGYRTELFDLQHFLPLGGGPIETTMNQESAISIAVMSLPPNRATFFRVPGPGIALVRKGIVEVAGGATHLIYKHAGLAGVPMRSGQRLSLEPGDSIASTVSGVSLRNSSAEQAEVLVVVLAPVDKLEEGTLLERGSRSHDVTTNELQQELLVEAGTEQVAGQSGMTIPAQTGATFEAGSGHFEAGFIHLPAGASVTVDQSAVIGVLGEPDFNELAYSAASAEGNTEITNRESEPLSIIIARYESAPEGAAAVDQIGQ